MGLFHGYEQCEERLEELHGSGMHMTIKSPEKSGLGVFFAGAFSYPRILLCAENCDSST